MNMLKRRGPKSGSSLPCLPDCLRFDVVNTRGSPGRANEDASWDVLKSPKVCRDGGAWTQSCGCPGLRMEEA